MTAAMIFPGMGPTTYPELARFGLVHPAARVRFAEADDAVGYRILRALKDSASDYSEVAQIAFMVTSVALADWAAESFGVAPALCVGPSFGAKPMTAFVGALPFADAVRLTGAVARVTDDYFAREHTELVTLSFARIGDDDLTDLLGELTARGVWHEVSCRVDESMHMVTLPGEASEALTRDIRAKGGMPLYEMRPPMHASVFGGLRDRVEQEIVADLEFADPSVPVIDDGTGKIVTTGAGVRDLLLDGYVRAVDWPRCVGTLQQAGVDEVCVAGPDALFSRVACTAKNFRVTPADPRRAMRPVERAA